MADNVQCSNKMRDAGRPYPRTCFVCGLGPCRYTSSVRPPEPLFTDASAGKEVIEKHMEAAKQIVDGVLLSDLGVMAVADALANAEREGMKRAAEKVKPSGNRPCDCDRCYCGNVGDLEAVTAWDQQDALYRAILSEAGEA